MQKDNKSKEQKDPLNDALDQFDDSPLNLTNEDKPLDEDDPELNAKMQIEYQKLLQEMKKNGFNDEGMGSMGVDNMGEMLGGLLKGLTETMGLNTGKEGDDLTKLFSGNINEANIEDIAGKLLGVFMKKQLLYEPLIESKNNYDQYFKKESGKISAADMQRYKAQYKVINQIIEVLDKDEQNKTKLMQLFQMMQAHGHPPTGITSINVPGGFS